MTSRSAEHPQCVLQLAAEHIVDLCHREAAGLAVAQQDRDVQVAQL